MIDGEIVTPDENGHTFGLGAGAGSTRHARLIVFDVLEALGSNCPPDAAHGSAQGAGRSAAPRVHRRSDRRLAEFDDGKTLLDWVAEHGLEGVVAKKRGSRYLDGTRQGQWLKIKVRREQEFVVCGWTPGKNGRAGRIGGLVLGMYDDDGRLTYCGRAGMDTNFDAELEEASSERPASATERARSVPCRRRSAPQPGSSPTS